MRSGIHPDYVESKVRCSCGATWVGPIGEQCSTCVAVRERHRQQLLAGPQSGESDESWALRLAHNCNAGALSKTDARAAIARIERRRQSDAA